MKMFLTSLTFFDPVRTPHVSGRRVEVDILAKEVSPSGRMTRGFPTMTPQSIIPAKSRPAHEKGDYVQADIYVCYWTGCASTVIQVGDG